MEERDSVCLAQRLDDVLVLAREVERLPARDEQRQLRAGGRELRELGRRGQQVLEVVEQEQQLLAANVLGEILPSRRETCAIVERDEHRLAEGGEADPEDAIGEELGDVGGGLQRRAGSCPIRPAPVSVNSRVVSSASRALTSWSSRSRPRNGVDGTGRFVW